MAKSSWQGTNATVWNVAGFLFIIAAIASLINEMIVYALASVAIAGAMFTIATSVKKRHTI